MSKSNAEAEMDTIDVSIAIKVMRWTRHVHNGRLMWCSNRGKDCITHAIAEPTWGEEPVKVSQAVGPPKVWAFRPSRSIECARAMEMAMSRQRRVAYTDRLYCMINDLKQAQGKRKYVSLFEMITATPLQRCEAALLTFEK